MKNGKQKHVPLRVCIVCRKLLPKGELFRMVKNREGKIISAVNETIAGKGIYVCPQEKCIYDFLNQKRFKKMYHSRISGENFNKIRELLDPPGTGKEGIG